MATIKEIEIKENWGIRPSKNVIVGGNIWLVDEGQEYTLVQFSINELKKSYFWNDCFCVPCDWSEEKIRDLVEKYAKEQITEEQIKDYNDFLESGEKWGWD